MKSYFETVWRKVIKTHREMNMNVNVDSNKDIPYCTKLLLFDPRI